MASEAAVAAQPAAVASTAEPEPMEVEVVAVTQPAPAAEAPAAEAAPVTAEEMAPAKEDGGEAVESPAAVAPISNGQAPVTISGDAGRPRSRGPVGREWNSNTGAWEPVPGYEVPAAGGKLSPNLANRPLNQIGSFYARRRRRGPPVAGRRRATAIRRPLRRRGRRPPAVRAPPAPPRPRFRRIVPDHPPNRPAEPAATVPGSPPAAPNRIARRRPRLCASPFHATRLRSLRTNLAGRKAARPQPGR